MRIYSYISISSASPHLYVKSSKASKKSKSGTFTINRCAEKLRYAVESNRDKKFIGRLCVLLLLFTLTVKSCERYSQRSNSRDASFARTRKQFSVFSAASSRINALDLISSCALRIHERARVAISLSSKARGSISGKSCLHN